MTSEVAGGKACRADPNKAQCMHEDKAGQGLSAGQTAFADMGATNRAFLGGQQAAESWLEWVEVRGP